MLILGGRHLPSGGGGKDRLQLARAEAAKSQRHVFPAPRSPQGASPDLLFGLWTLQEGGDVMEPRRVCAPAPQGWGADRGGWRAQPIGAGRAEGLCDTDRRDPAGIGERAGASRDRVRHLSGDRGPCKPSPTMALPPLFHTLQHPAWETGLQTWRKVLDPSPEPRSHMRWRKRAGARLEDPRALWEPRWWSWCWGLPAQGAPSTSGPCRMVSSCFGKPRRNTSPSPASRRPQTSACRLGQRGGVWGVGRGRQATAGARVSGTGSQIQRVWATAAAAGPSSSRKPPTQQESSHHDNRKVIAEAESSSPAWSPRRPPAVTIPRGACCGQAQGHIRNSCPGRPTTGAKTDAWPQSQPGLRLWVPRGWDSGERPGSEAPCPPPPPCLPASQAPDPF